MLTVKRKTDVFLFLFFLDSLNVTDRLSLILLTISKEWKTINAHILKGTVATIYGQLGAFLNSNDPKHARAWRLPTGGVYHHSQVCVRTVFISLINTDFLLYFYAYSKIYAYDRF